MKLTINQTYQNLIPALKEDEFKQLEENILKEGIREKLTVWNNTIIDGHNRYAIATKHNIPFEIHEKQFESENDAKIWMIDNQKGRRNLTDWVKHELAQVKREILKEIGMKKKAESGNLGGRGNKNLLSIMDKRFLKENHNTRNEIANDLGWSQVKVARADVVRKHIDQTNNEALREKLRNNEVSINQAYQEVKRKNKLQEVKAKEEQHKEKLQLESSFDIDIYNTDKKFNIIYADPAWSYWSGGQKNQSLHYPTMSIDQICQLPIDQIADDNAILFLWVTYPILQESFKVIESWGFQYSTCGFCWVKTNKNSGTPFFGNGAWTRANSELCLIAKKGSITRINASISQVLQDPIQEHSRKPYRVRKLITDLVGELPRIELFSRRTENDGWYNWGNKI